MQKSKIRPQVIAALAGSLSMTSLGFHVGWPSTALVKLQAEHSDIPVMPEEGSWIVSFLMIGSICGALLGSVLADSIGRKATILLTSISYFVSSDLIAFAESHWWFYPARFIAGIGNGIAFTVLPLYLGEIAEDRVRGALGALSGNMSNVGVLIVYLAGPWASRPTVAGLGACLAIISGLTFVWMPESPYFLVMKKRTSDAERSLVWLRGTGDVNKELKSIEENVELELKSAGTYKELVTIPGNRKALVIVVGLIIAQQFDGAVAIISYSSLIFEESGVELSYAICAVITGFIQVISGLLTIFTIDVAGRRSLLLISASGAVIFLSGEALYFQLKFIGIDVTSFYWLPVTAIVGLLLSDVIGLGSLPYIVLSEIFPCSVKAKASMIVTVMGALGALAVTQIYEILSYTYGRHVAFWFFAVSSVCSLIFIYYFVPETKQKSLHDIHCALQQRNESKIGLADPQA